MVSDDLEYVRLGYRVETPNDKLPAVVYGVGAKPGPVTVSVSDSSTLAMNAPGNWLPAVVAIMP